MKPMRLLITGPPGSGKGTFAELLCEKTYLHHISAGDLLREHVKKEDDIGKRIKEIMQRGDLVPDDLVNEVVEDRITQGEIKTGFLLDGHPRSVMQAEFLTGIEQITGVIVVTLPEEVIIERLSQRRMCPKCKTSYHLALNRPKKEGVCDHDGEKLIQRDDDKPEVIKHRINLYNKQTRPIIEYFKEHNIPVIEIRGDYNIDTEADQIIKKIIDWQTTAE